MRQWRPALAAFVLLSLSSLPAIGQVTSVSIQLSGADSDKLSGALVALIDSAGTVRAEGLSNARGATTLHASPGSYRLRVRRIGFRPLFHEGVTLPYTGILQVPVQSSRVVLNTMVVSAKAECGTVGEDAATLAEVWEEIAKALRASQLTASDKSSIERASVYVREIDSRGVVLKADTAHISAQHHGRPFGSVDPASLVKDGYVRGNEAKGWEYFGPDEAVLLSRGFAETHCFRIVREDRRPGEIGLAFEPSASRKLADIDGVLWLDENTSELREMTFTYVNADVVSRFKPSGFTRFQRMPSGAWIVSEWRLKMPRLGRRAGSWQNDLIGHTEKGGRIVGRSTPTG